MLGRKQTGGDPVRRPSLVQPFQEFIRQTLEQYPALRATRLYDMLTPRGYRGSLRSLRDYVSMVRPEPKAKAYLRLETLAGEQAQIDWAHVGRVRIDGGERTLWVFVMVLSYSRALWAELVFDMSVESLCRSLTRAAAYFGGVTRQWLFDYVKRHVIELMCHPRYVAEETEVSFAPELDDNVDFAALLAEALRCEGFQTAVEHNARSALERWQSFVPHAAVLDVGLPELDGYELAKALREQHGADPTLSAATGYGQQKDRLRAADAGFDCHFVKPVRVRDLVLVLDQRVVNTVLPDPPAS